MGAVAGYGDALQASCLEGFNSLGLHQINTNMKIPKIIFASLLVVGPLLVVIDSKDLRKLNIFAEAPVPTLTAASPSEWNSSEKKYKNPHTDHVEVAPVETPPPVAHDWLEITDKVVDWAVKIIGAIATLIGALGFKRKQEAKVTT